MSGEAVQVRLLGPVDVTVGGAPCPFPGLRRKSVLAILALHPGEVVSADRLIDVVWEDNPPATAANTLQRHISYLRRALRSRDAVVARPPGYLLNLPAEAVDVSQAMRLIDTSGRGDDHASSAAQLTAALELWRGPSLTDVSEVAWLRGHAHRLDEARLDATERLVEARLALGEHLPLVAELEELTAQHPFRENLHGLLMLALYRCGRQADALAAYHRLRQVLGGELGIDPSPALRDLEAAVLRQDAELDVPSPAASGTSVGPVWIAPAQLPQAVAAFTGRRDQLARLRSHLPSAPDDPGRPQAATVVVVSGTAGVGKTALAVHWAHQVKRRFADGQLYVNLRGFDPTGGVMDPAEAVRGFLDALGVPRDQIPASAQAQVSLYRSVLASKRVLVVADNVRDEEQVRPLLPGAPGCLVVVTSRNQLPGLVAADGAHPLTLDRPPVAEARQILAERLGRHRVRSEPEAVDEIVARCARLPLAMAVAAARAVWDPALPLAGLAAQLRDAATTLDSFDGADPATNIRAVFSWSYHALSDPTARLFRLLGLCPGPDIALPAAASVAGLPVRDVRPLLAELTRTHLLTETSPGRFGFHDLLRTYAAEQAHHHDTTEQRAAERHRFLDHHLHTAHAATLLLKPGRSPIDLAAPAPGVTPQPLADLAAALTWFTAERAVLLATMVRQPDGFDRHTWQLAWALLKFLSTRGDWQDNELVQQAGLSAAQRLGDRSGQAYAHRSLCTVYTDLGRLAEAQHHIQSALRLFEQVGNPVALTDIHLNLSMIADRQGDIHQALSHAERAHRSYRSLGHLAGQAYAANNIGWYHGLLGNQHSGLVYCQEALDILTEIDDVEATAITWDSLGALHFGVGDPPQGEHCYQQAIALYRRLGDRFGEADAHANLGDRHHRAGNRDAARQAWQQAVAILDDLEPDAAGQIRARLDGVPAS